MLKKSKVVFFLSIVLSIAFSCSTTDPKLEPDLALKLEDVSCTEAWLQLTTNNIQLPATVNLLKNNSVTQTFSLSTKDSLLFIDSLLPNQTYKLQVSGIQNPVSSNELSVTTMDTTSHNFTWQTFTFGEHSSSTLYDVAIINENDIWAVGEIYMNDSLGNPDPICYNAVHWDGFNWQVKKIAVAYNGNQTIAPLNGIYILPSEEIIFSSGLPYLPQGNGWKLYHLWDMGILDQDDGSVDKIWGTSINNLYFVGYKGTIVHYDGNNWTRIESNTTLPIRDIYGIKKRNNENFEILSVADSYGSNEGSKIISITNNSTKTIWNDGRPYGLVSVWFITDRKYFVVGDGLWESLTPTKNWVKNNSFPSLYKNNIRGQSFNDMVVGGAFWLLAHYNGYSWQTYFPSNSGSFTSVKIKENTIIGVGGSSSKAIVVIGKR